MQACTLAHSYQGLHFMQTPSVEVQLISFLCMHVCIEATCEGSGECAHWHSLTRAYALCIHQVWKYMKARPKREI